jgi:hypothetical protein
VATDILNVTELLANSFEPLRQFRFILSIDGIDAFTVKSSSRPQLTFGETVIDYINQKRYLAGKGTWAPMTLSLYDPIVPSASVKVLEWTRRCWENITGRMGYSAMYKKEITLKLLDGIGAVVQQWTLQGAWVQDFNGNALDYSVDDPCQIDLTIRYDQAVLEF